MNSMLETIKNLTIVFSFISTVSIICTSITLSIIPPHTATFLAFATTAWLSLDNWILLCDLHETSAKLESIESNELSLINRIHALELGSNRKCRYVTLSTMHWVQIAARARALHYLSKVPKNERGRNRNKRFRKWASFQEKKNDIFAQDALEKLPRNSETHNSL
jgi:hypothetical protein